MSDIAHAPASANEVHDLRMRLASLEKLIEFTRHETQRKAAGEHDDEAQRVASLEAQVGRVLSFTKMDIAEAEKRIVAKFKAADLANAETLVDAISNEVFKLSDELKEVTSKSARAAAADAESMRLVVTQQATVAADMLTALAETFAEGN